MSRLYVRVGILQTFRKHLHVRIISQRGEVWAHRTSLAPPLLLTCLYQARKVSKLSCIYVLVVSILSPFTNLLLDFRTALTVW
jgi:hypothetical protein